MGTEVIFHLVRTFTHMPILCAHSEYVCFDAYTFPDLLYAYV